MSPDEDDERPAILPGFETIRSLGERGWTLASFGFGALKEGIEAVEREAVRRVREHLDHISGEAPPEESGEAEDPDPGDVLAELVDRGITQTAAEARREHLARTVKSLVPDEAKILVSMVDGRAHALINVDAATPLGAQRVLSNVTTERLAGIRSKDLVRQYVAHLIELGLVEVGPEETGLEVEYQLLEASQEVREAEVQIELRRLSKIRVERRSLRLSALGRELWDGAAAPPDQP